MTWFQPLLPVAIFFLFPPQNWFCFRLLQYKSRISLRYQEMLRVRNTQSSHLVFQPLLKLILQSIGSSSTPGLYLLFANVALARAWLWCGANTDKESNPRADADLPPTLSTVKEKLQLTTPHGFLFLYRFLLLPQVLLVSELLEAEVTAEEALTL